MSFSGHFILSIQCSVQSPIPSNSRVQSSTGIFQSYWSAWLYAPELVEELLVIFHQKIVLCSYICNKNPYVGRGLMFRQALIVLEIKNWVFSRVASTYNKQTNAPFISHQNVSERNLLLHLMRNTVCDISYYNILYQSETRYKVLYWRKTALRGMYFWKYTSFKHGMKSYFWQA